MFNATWMTKYEGEVETLKLKRKVTCLGIYEDINGNEWDVSAIMGSFKELVVCHAYHTLCNKDFTVASYITLKMENICIVFY